MSFQITCPHCGIDTRYQMDQIGQRAACPNCKNTFAIEPDAPAAPTPPHRLPDVALQMTCRGGAIGCSIAAAITVLFTFVPLTVSLVAAFALLFQPQAPAEAGLKLLVLLALEVAIPCVLGAVCGAVLIWLCTFLLSKSPTLFEYAWRGAAFLAVLPPGIVFLSMSLPLLVQLGVVDVKGLAPMRAHWMLSMGLASLGAVTGALLGLLIGVIRERRRSAAD